MSKLEYRKVYGKSPDVVDALMLTFVYDVIEDAKSEGPLLCKRI